MSDDGRRRAPRTPRGVGPGWALFGSGYVCLGAPDPAHLDVEDVAYGLATQARFKGALRRWVDLACHSVLLSLALEADGYPRSVQRCGLFHDASEAYLGDVPRPAKVLMPDYRRLEGALMRALAARFYFDWPPPPVVKAYDLRALVAEHRRYHRASTIWLWDVPAPQAVDFRLAPGAGEWHDWQWHDWRTSARAFLARWREVRG